MANKRDDMAATERGPSNPLGGFHALRRDVSTSKCNLAELGWFCSSTRPDPGDTPDSSPSSTGRRTPGSASSRKATRQRSAHGKTKHSAERSRGANRSAGAKRSAEYGANSSASLTAKSNTGSASSRNRSSGTKGKTRGSGEYSREVAREDNRNPDNASCNWNRPAERGAKRAG